MNKITGAVIGLGVGEKHARAMAGCKGVVLKYVCDMQKKKADTLAVELNSVSTGCYEEIINDSEVNLVVISSYDDAHYQQVVAALETGKHVFVEKPMCLSMEELETIKHICVNRPDLYLASNLVLRSAKIYPWLMQSISRGEYGRVYSVEGSYLWGRLWKLKEGWRKEVSRYSIILGASIHLIDTMLRITKEKPRTVSSYGNNICTEGSGFGGSDFVTSIFRFDSGMIGNITANAGCIHPHQHVLKVYGTKRTFICDDQGPRVFKEAGKGASPENLDMPALPDTSADYLKEFIGGIIRGEDAAGYSQREFDLMGVCLAAQEALETGKATKVKYP